MSKQDEEIAFLKVLLQEKEQVILDNEKKLRLAEFRTKKQVQEITLLMETEKLKADELQEKFKNQSELLEEFKEKCIQQDQMILNLRQEKVDTQPEEDEQAKEQAKRFKPRQSMIVRMGNDITQLPSYTDLVTFVQQQSGDQESQVKLVQDEAVTSLVERDTVILELQEKERKLQKQLTDGEIKITEQQNKILDQDSSQRSQQIEKEQNQQLIISIKELSDQNEMLKANSAQELSDMQDRLKDEYLQKMLEQETDSGKRESLLIQQMQVFEDKVRQLEDVIHESSSVQQQQLNALMKTHTSDAKTKDKEIQDHKDQLTVEAKINQDNLAKIQLAHDAQIKQFNKEGDDHKSTLESVNKKVTKLENERERREALIQEYKQIDIDAKAELQLKSDQVNKIVDTYEAQLLDLQVSLKQEKKKFEIESLKQSEKQEESTQQRSTHDELLSINMQQKFQNKVTLAANKQELTDLREDNSKQKQKVESLDTECAQMKQNIISIENEREQLREKISLFEGEVGNLKEMVTSIENEREQLSEKIILLEATSGQSKDQVTSIELDKEQLREKIIILEKESKENVTSIEKEREEVREKIILVEATNGQLRDKVTSIEKERDQLREQIISIEGETGQSKENVSIIEQEGVELREKIISVEALNEQLRENVTSIEKEREDLREKIILVEGECEKLTGQLKQQISSIESEKHNLREQIISLESECEQLKAKIISFETDKSQSKEEFVLLQLERGQSKEEFILLETECKLMKEKFISLEAQRLESGQKEFQIDDERQKLQERIISLEAERNADLEKFQEKVSSLENERIELKEKVNSMLASLEQSEKEHASNITLLQMSYNAQRATLVSLHEQTLNSSQAQSDQKIKELAEEIIDLKQSLQDAEWELEKQSISPSQKSSGNTSKDLLELQKEVSKLNFKERELLIQSEKNKNDFASERAQLLILQREIESKNILLEDQIEFEVKERQYAEQVAARESVMRADMAMEHEISMQEARQYYKMIQAMKKT